MKGLLLAVLILAAFPARAEAESAPVVLAADPWCPHTCAADPSRPGYMVEIIRRAFALSGIAVTYRTMAWSRAMTDAREGRIDGVIGTLADEAADMDLPREAVGYQVNAIAVRAEDSWTPDGMDSLAGRSIGVIQDYSYSFRLDEWLARHPDRVQALGGENALDRNLRKLIAGRIDTVIEDEAVLTLRLKEWSEGARVRLAGRMAGGPLFVAFSRRTGRGEDLAGKFDRGVRVLRASGELDRIMLLYGMRGRGR